MSTLKKNNRGFTLAELIVVILIIGILATSAAPNIIDLTTGARFVGTKATVESIREVLLLYFMEHGTYPVHDVNNPPPEPFFGVDASTYPNGAGVILGTPAWDYFTKAPVNFINDEPDFVYVESLGGAQLVASAYPDVMALPVGFWYIGNPNDANFGMVGAFGLTEGCGPSPVQIDLGRSLCQALSCGQGNCCKDSNGQPIQCS